MDNLTCNVFIHCLSPPRLLCISYELYNGIGKSDINSVITLDKSRFKFICNSKSISFNDQGISQYFKNVLSIKLINKLFNNSDWFFCERIGICISYLVYNCFCYCVDRIHVNHASMVYVYLFKYVMILCRDNGSCSGFIYRVSLCRIKLNWIYYFCGKCLFNSVVMSRAFNISNFFVNLFKNCIVEDKVYGTEYHLISYILNCYSVSLFPRKFIIFSCFCVNNIVCCICKSCNLHFLCRSREHISFKKYGCFCLFCKTCNRYLN